MDDARYTFEQRNRELRGAVNGARHRVSGAKSSYVGLPSDNLTPAQLRKKNGPLTVLRLNAPMTWREFKFLSEEHQRMYLQNLVNRYRASDKMLGLMFGIDGSMVSLKRKALCIDSLGRGHRISPEDMAQWDKFLSGVLQDSGVVPLDTPEQDTTASEEQDTSPAPVEEAQRLEPITTKLTQRDFAITVENVHSWSDLEPYMAFFTIDSTMPATVHIEVHQ